MRTFIKASLLSATFFVPSTAHAYTWNLCMKHWVYSADSGYGEDYEVSTSGYDAWESRGSKVRVFKGGVWYNVGNTDPDTGCINFTSGTDGNATIELTAQHTLANSQTIYIKNGYGGANLTKSWSFATNLPSSNSTLYYYTPYGDESNLAAIVPWMVHRITSLTGNLSYAAGRTLKVYNQNCSAYLGSCDGSAYAPGITSLFIDPTKDHSDRKFLVGHEVGHWTEKGWTSGNSGGGGGYSYEDSEFFCKFQGLGSHGLRSRELDFPAYVEGIAHFLSSIAWNDPGQGSGVFKYYKSTGQYNYDTFLLDTPGSYAFDWETSMCPPNLDDYSVEGDWLRHFWNYLNDPTGTDFQPTLFAIAEQINQTYVSGGLGTGNIYQKLLDALTHPDLDYNFWVGHWTTRANTHGVDDL